MPRRVGLPGASELFRPTAADALVREADAARTAGREPVRRRTAPRAVPDADVTHTGRVRHDEKITVYVSSEELLALEHLRLELRAEHGIAVDRGRIVRAAIAAALAEVRARGGEADVVQRLVES
ncbi:hypothetical protein [Propioniciclava sp.]|uniref:hypothetical protein n=1 Tax=Propioniciclava sp. TaxID=2038686 RepID=UPI00261ADCC1|nr:hypothetical protein [Propioniciclava sp.]